MKSCCVLQDHYDDEHDKTVFHNTTPDLQDQDHDRFFWSQTGLVLRPTVSDHITAALPAEQLNTRTSFSSVAQSCEESQSGQQQQNTTATYGNELISNISFYGICCFVCVNHSRRPYWAFTRYDRRTDRSVRPRLRPTVCQTSRTDGRTDGRTDCSRTAHICQSNQCGLLADYNTAYAAA